MSIYITVLAEPVTELSLSASSSLPSSPPSSSSAATDLPPPGGDPEDDEGMKHLQQVLENSQYPFEQSSTHKAFTPNVTRHKPEECSVYLSVISAFAL